MREARGFLVLQRRCTRVREGFIERLDGDIRDRSIHQCVYCKYQASLYAISWLAAVFSRGVEFTSILFIF